MTEAAHEKRINAASLNPWAAYPMDINRRVLGCRLRRHAQANSSHCGCAKAAGFVELGILDTTALDEKKQQKTGDRPRFSG
ncbi:MAG: hypothetical protein WAZ34_09370 [Rhodocyclaceae bacterium]